MSFIFGAILLAVAILGGGFEIKEIKVSNVTTGVRLVAGIVGLIFIALGFWEQPSALTSGAPGTSGTDAPRVASRPLPKPAEALLAERYPSSPIKIASTLEQSTCQHEITKRSPSATVESG